MSSLKLHLRIPFFSKPMNSSGTRWALGKYPACTFIRFVVYSYTTSMPTVWVTPGFDRGNRRMSSASKFRWPSHFRKTGLISLASRKLRCRRSKCRGQWSREVSSDATKRLILPHVQNIRWREGQVPDSCGGFQLIQSHDNFEKPLRTSKMR